ncbi:MAG: MarR family transcriptional regulator [Bacteroides sp.]|nr:MarR family transcriptional regulator [Eubacterium sp.]MCM1417896.1 MarR family transcriptional regulator [Roseburia sp.]MCM1461940.1 MarR family transcriptional regulator [Bacteroides sp.]
MEKEEVKKLTSQYRGLRDVQYAAYDTYARRHGLSSRELALLEQLWCSPGGCLQSELGVRLSSARQTISITVKKFVRLGYVTIATSESDRRIRVVTLTSEGKRYLKKLIPPIIKAENDAMSALTDEDAAALTRITALFSERMKENYDKL